MPSGTERDYFSGVVFLILKDANLKVDLGKQKYQINAIIGYPVFQALGAITFLRDGWFEAGDTARRSAVGTRMYLKLLTPVIECGVEGKNLPFSFDTGASGSNLSVRYLNATSVDDTIIQIKRAEARPVAR